VPGRPKVHYAAIGSADVLLRDEVRRDEVRRDEIAATHQIMAVEMEGSGVAAGSALHGVQWFVVRGVVDYCENPGKNDVWHAHSSLAAAAYVRALLARCHPFTPSTARTAHPGQPATAPAAETAAAEVLDLIRPDGR
jgi:nucleoside phosphorylase